MNGMLDRLAATFSAKSIMVSKGQLVTAQNPKHAISLLERHSDFNLIPIEANGDLVGYVERSDSTLKPIIVDQLVSDSTPILDLVTHLSVREFVFVLSQTSIAGYIHFSDLNSSVVKLPFFVLFEALERHLLLQLRYVLTLERVEREFGKKKANRLNGRLARLQEEDANRGWDTVLSFGDVLRLASGEHILSMEDGVRERVIGYRNRVSHAGHALIQRHKEVADLASVRFACETVLT